MNLLIQNAHISDIDNINYLMRISKAYWGYDDTFLNRFMNIIGIKENYLRNNTIKLVYLNNQLVGFYNFIVHKDNSYELDNFFLHSDFIGKGFGRKMWEHCCNDVKQ